jgi:predicted acyltransferase
VRKLSLSTEQDNNMESHSKSVIPIDRYQTKVRYLSIDVFRGLAIVTMIFVNTLAEYTTTPAWSKHASDFGLTYVDLVAPFFIFAIALTYKMTFDSYVKKEGVLKAYIRVLRRYAAFLGFGFLGGIFISPEGINFGWDVLQAIGLAGIFTMFFIQLPRIYRFLLGFIFLEVYQFLISLTLNLDGTLITISDLGFGDNHGGFVGGFGFGAMLLISTALVDNFRKTDKREFLIFGSIFSVLGAGLHYLWKYTGFPTYGGLSKLRVTHSYVLLTIGLAAIVFWLLWLIYDYRLLTKRKSYFLQPPGKNAFLLFVLQPLFTIVLFIYLREDIHAAFVFLIGFINVAAIWTISYFLDKKKIYVII